MKRKFWPDGPYPRGQPRLLVIQSCGSCPYSMDREICTHPQTEGRTHALGWGDPPILYRPLPEADSRYGAWKANAPPPDWCPLEESEWLEVLKEIAAEASAARVHQDFSALDAAIRKLRKWEL